MKKFSLDISLFILIFLFALFCVSNIGFFFGQSINISYILISLIFPFIYLYKNKKIYRKLFVLIILFLMSFVFANLFIGTSFDGRCYHFTIENLFKLGYNPIFNNIENFSKDNNIYYNLLFANSYPNMVEILRSNFYLLFKNMEASKIVNFLFMFSCAFYSFYFFLNKFNKLKAVILTICTLLCAVSICQINTKMVDFIFYYLFIFQLFSIILINEKKNVKYNSLILILSSILMIGIKYTGLYSTTIIFILFLAYKYDINKLKIFLSIVALSIVVNYQPYITNIIKFKNPFYPSIGYNKLDFMTKQNPREFISKPYLYKFFRSMFSSSSDARINNPDTPKLYWKIPFTKHFDMPYIAEDVRISGFGHLFSGIFLISLILSILLIKRKQGIFVFLLLYLSVFLNPICWWARFVPQLHLCPIFCAYYYKKNNYIFYILTILIILNGLMIVRENVSVTAYKTYVMNNFYNNLYEISQNKKIYVYKDSKKYDENDETILNRLKEYGIKYTLVNKYDEKFYDIKTDATITNSYKIKY